MTVKQRAPIVLAVLAAGAALWFGVLRPTNDDDTLAASGTVEATEADLGFQTAGRIESIVVREGDRVKAGQELARLDLAELEARRHAAQAQVAAARALLVELETGSREEEVLQARAALRAAEERVTNAERDAERLRRLFEGGAVSRQALDHQESALEQARAERDRARESLRLVEAGPRRERISAQRAALAQAGATVAQINAVFRQAVVAAPFDGVVTVRHREPGETVAPGVPVVTVMNPDDRWVRIYVREDAAGRIALSQPATIRADAYPDRTYGGEVRFIASEAQFTPRNVQTTEERVKLVYEVRVRVTRDPSFDLKPGLAADVRLEPRGP
ncbi:MAG TPA: efflux RND transporter periplasmic adaptor subunit [Gemmatimonadales bacterium]|nr:efflux RND transporter periplasmic adaptor subunit [Gemmatimonadales bacterium]